MKIEDPVRNFTLALAVLCALAWAGPVRADAYRGTPTYERALLYFHSPAAIQKDQLLARLQEVSKKLQLPLEVYDTGKDEGFVKLLRLERELKFPGYGHNVLVAGWRVAVDPFDIMTLLDELASGKVSLDDPPPPPETNPPAGLTQIASGGKYVAVVEQSAPGDKDGAAVVPVPAAGFPPFGSWTITAILMAAGVFAGAFFAARRGARAG